jgi:hypothetical protein
MKKTKWICANEDCEDNDTYYFRGLCRSCTTYDDNGVVIEAVPRVRTIPKVDNTVMSARPMTRRDKMAVDRHNRDMQKQKTRNRKFNQWVRTNAPEGVDAEQLLTDIATGDIANIGEEVPHVHGPDCGHDLSGGEEE